MEIERIRRINVSDQVFAQLKERIFDGTWKPGDRLPSELELTEAFGVSRVTIRQAIQRLATIGLIETRLGEGSFVRNPNFDMHINQLLPAMYLGEDSLQEVSAFRVITEVEAVGLATERVTDADITKLWENYARYTSDCDLDAYVETDIEFHMMITRIAGNSIMVRMEEILNDVLRCTIKDMTRVAGRENGTRYHRLIIQALARRDQEAARQLMKEHLQSAVELVMEQSEKRA